MEIGSGSDEEAHTETSDEDEAHDSGDDVSDIPPYSSHYFENFLSFY